MKASERKKLQLGMTPSVFDLFTAEASKSQLQKMRIIEVAIESFAEEGIEKTTYSFLAKKCDISRSLIHHYFPTIDSMFSLAALYVRHTIIRLATEAMSQAPADPRLQLKAYIEGQFKWVGVFPAQTRFWMLFYFQSSRGGKARQENSELVALGHRRIQQLILSGKEKGYWHFRDLEATAKTVQLLITGGIISCITEDGYLSLENASQLVLKGIESLLAIHEK
jgi:AcrR family transcriptional regulator